MVAQPKRIATGVYRLPSRGSNSYFVRTGASWVLIDTAWAGSEQPIRAAAETLFGANARPAAILLTHVHPDHSGAALALARLWDVPVFVHSSELPLAEGSLAAAERYPAGPLDRRLILPLMRALPARTVESLTTKSSLKGVAQGYDPRDGVPALPDWQCIPTPGHTPGHVAFFRSSDGVLIAGDALLTVNLNSLWDFLLDKRRVSGPPYITTWDWQAAKESVAALARLEPRVLACGHGVPLSGASVARKTQAFADQFSAAGSTQGTTQGTTSGGRADLMERMRRRLRHAMAKSSTDIGVWLYRLTGGRISRLFGAPSEALVLTTRGRRSGKWRSVVLQGFRDGADLIVVASNVGRAANPGWYFNLKATPLAQVELMGSVMQVQAEELSAEEAATFWSRLLRLYPAYGRYQRRIARVIPLIRLTRVEAPSMQAAARGEKVEV